MRAQTKNLVGLLVAAGLAGAVGLYAYFGVLRADQTVAERKAVDAQLVALHAPGERLPDGGVPGPAVFTALSVTAQGQTTTLEPRADGWFLTAPIPSKADGSVVEQLLRELETGKVKEQIEAAPDAAALQRYGLSPPRFVVGGTAHGGDPSKARTFTIEGGIENPYDGTVYLRRGGDPAVYSAPVRVRTALERTTWDLRDKALFPARPEDVVGIELTVSGAPRYALKRDDGGWRLDRPALGAADAEEVGALLAALFGERITGFPDAASGAAVPRPDQSVTLVLRDRRTLRLELVKDRGTEKVLARRTIGEEPAQPIELNASILGHLDRPAAELRDRSVLRFDREAVTRVVFQGGSGGEAIEVRRENDADAGTSDAWVVTSPERGKVKDWKVTTVLWALSSLKANAPAADAPRDWARFGLGNDARKVQLFAADGALLAELRVGTAVKGAADRVHARGNRPGLFEVDAAKLGELPAKVDDLLERPATDGGVSAAAPN